MHNELGQLDDQLWSGKGGSVNLRRELDALTLNAEWKAPKALNDPEVPPFLAMAEIGVDAFLSGPKGPILHAPVDDGRTLSFLASHVDYVHAMGEDADMVALAGERAKRKGLKNVIFQTGNLTSLPFQDGNFAGVYCAEYLGHLRKPCRMLKELIRVCAPGGYVIADFIAPQDSTRSIDGMEPSTDGGYVHEKTFYRFMDPWRLEEILGQAGALKLEVQFDEMSWRNDGNFENHDVLALRHSLVVRIRRNRR